MINERGNKTKGNCNDEEEDNKPGETVRVSDDGDDPGRG